MNYPFETLFLVCTGARCNADDRGNDGGLAIREELKDLNKDRGRKRTVRVVSVSCLDLCDHGPNVLVWPQGTVFSHLSRKTSVLAYEGVMGDGPSHPELELREDEFLAGGSKAAKR